MVKVATGDAKYNCCTSTAKVGVSIGADGARRYGKPRPLETSATDKLYPDNGLYPKHPDSRAYKDWGQYYDSRCLSVYPEFRRNHRLGDTTYPVMKR